MKVTINLKTDMRGVLKVFQLENGWEKCISIIISKINILSHQGNANQNTSGIPSYTQSEWLRLKTLMIAYAGDDARKGNTTPLLVGVQNCIATWEISMVDSQKIGNQPTPRSTNNTLGHIPKGCAIILQGHLLNCVHSSIICNCQILKTT